MLCRTCSNTLAFGPSRADGTSQWITGSVEETQIDNPWLVHHVEELCLRNSIAEGCTICSALWERMNQYFLSRPDGWISVELITFHRPTPDAINVQRKIQGHREFCWQFQISYEVHSSGLRVGSSNLKLSFQFVPKNYDTYTAPEAQTTNFSTCKATIDWWLRDCVQNHEECRPQSPVKPRAPKRLLDLGTSSSESLPRLIVTSEHDSFRQPQDSNAMPCYATLSHCWGGLQPLSLQGSNFDDLKRGIPTDRLSQTFSDAIKISRGLGVRYLWIDSLCIFQDQNTDWMDESMAMGDIYGGGTFNIAATGALDGSEGLFFEKDPKVMAQPTEITIQWKGLLKKEYLIVQDSKSWRDRFEQLPLNRRAWVIQERILATRNLHFTKEQLVWECRKYAASEVFRRGFPMHLLEYHMSRNTILQPAGSVFHSHWAELVRSYSRGELTFPTDRPVAIRGLALEIHKRTLTSGEYCAGMWDSQLPISLLWARDDQDQHIDRGQLERCDAPSWSWITLNAPISTRWTIFDGEIQKILVENLKWYDEQAPVDDDFTSHGVSNPQVVPSPVLLIQGFLGEVTWKQKWEWIERMNDVNSFHISSLKVWSAGGQSDSAPHQFEANVWNDVVFDKSNEYSEEGHEQRTLCCMPICLAKRQGVEEPCPETSVFGLLLEPVSQDCFRRVGVFSVGPPDCRAFMMLETQNFKML